ncbi:MAG: hypothetical protein P4L33_08475 [Capsulimonadaceae bacterium]|nr:hypothetical protein [Capsulimonadaceae bacterium]
MRDFVIQCTVVALLAVSLAFASARVPIGAAVASSNAPSSALVLQLAASGLR